MADQRCYKFVTKTDSALWVIVQKLMTAFPFSYLVQLEFRAEMNLMKNKINRLEIIARVDFTTYKH